MRHVMHVATFSLSGRSEFVYTMEIMKHIQISLIHDSIPFWMTGMQCGEETFGEERPGDRTESKASEKCRCYSTVDETVGDAPTKHDTKREEIRAGVVDFGCVWGPCGGSCSVTHCISNHSVMCKAWFGRTSTSDSRPGATKDSRAVQKSIRKVYCEQANRDSAQRSVARCVFYSNDCIISR